MVKPCGRCSRWRSFCAGKAGKCRKKAGDRKEHHLRSWETDPAPPTDSEGELVLFNRKNGRSQYAAAPAAAKPLGRSEDLIVQEVEDEVLVYDELSNRAHCLSADAARVWRACDGVKSEQEIATA